MVIIIADRTVKVSLVLAAQGYMQGMDAAAKKTREMGSETEKLAQKKESFNVLGTAALGFGAAVAAGIGMAVSRFAEFDAQMSAVQAATHETAGNMDLLRDAAIDAGARTVYSASEAAAAIEELSKAGISTADVLSGGLDGALDLAAAGNIAVANAAEIAASAMTQFGLSGQDVTHVADLLSAGAGKAQGGVEEMSRALNQSGLVAAQMGLSLDETVGTLTHFASAGLLGSDAGTSFRNMLLRLANPTKEARGLMDELGLSFYDAQGEFVGMEGVAAQLQTRLAGLTQEQRNAALANLFGQDAIRSASILYEGGATAVREWEEAVNDSGYAAETAATRLDNLKGDWEALTGAVDSALITMGEGGDGPLRALVQGAADMVNQFNSMPDWSQQTALGVAAVTAAVALGGGAFMLAVPKVAAYNAAIATMGTGAQRASSLVGALGKTVGAAAGFFALAKGAEMAANGLGQLGDGAKSANDTMSLLLEKDYDGIFEGMTKGAGGVNDLANAMDKLLAGDFNNAFNRWGSDTFAFTGLTSSVGEAREQFSLMGQSLADMVSRGDGDRAAAIFNDLRERFEEQGYTVDQLNEVMPEYQDALTGVANDAEIAGTAVNGATGDVEGMADAAADAERNLDDLRDALDNVGRTALDMGDAQDQAQSAINRMAEAAKAEGASLFGTNDASISLRDSLREVEESHRTSAEAMLNNGLSADEATAAYRRGREGLLDQIQGYFDSREAAAQWADTNLGSAAITEQAILDVATAIQNVPDPDPIRFAVDTSEASRGLDQWINTNNGRTIRVRVAADGGSIQMGSYTVTPNATGNLYEKGVKAKDFAAGGWASGVGMARATPGGLLRVAEAGYDEAIISTDPKYRARSIGLLEEMAGRLGMWQQPTISASAPAWAGPVGDQRTVHAPITVKAQPGMSEAQLARKTAGEINKALR